MAVWNELPQAEEEEGNTAMIPLEQMLLMVLAAITVESVFFSRGMGFYEILQGAGRGRNISAYSLFLTVFSIGSGFLSRWIAEVTELDQKLWLLLLAAGSVLLCYLVVCLVLVILFPSMYRKVGWCIGPAAINTTVFSMPFLAEQQQWGNWQMLGFAIGTGLAFWLLSWIMAEQLPRLRHISMPAAFQGMPAAFLFLGILALGFLGFGGI